MRNNERNSRRRTLPSREPGKKIDLKQLIRLGIIAGVIAAVILVSVNLIVRGNVALSPLAKKETVKIGVRTDVAGFGQISADGKIQGFDADVAAEVVSRVFGKNKPIAFISLTSEDAGANIKYGKMDIGLGFLAAHTDRVQGFLLTDPYYRDDVILITADSAVRSQADLNGKKIGILNSILSSAQSGEFLKSKGISAQVSRYFAFDQAALDLDAKTINAFMVPQALVKQYLDKYTQVGEPLGQIGYSIILSSSEGAVQGAMTDAIHAMQRDGALQKLAKKWGVPYKK